MMRRYSFFGGILLLLSGCRSTIVDDPSTTISFIVEQRSHVRLEIENSYNTIVAVPVDQICDPGVFTATLNESYWTEGVYFYTLECTGINSNYHVKITKQMILIK